VTVTEVGETVQEPVDEPLDIRVGVLLTESAPVDSDADQDLDGTGHEQAWGNRGRHVAARDGRVALLGREVLRAAAEAVGREVAFVVSGVVAGIEHPDPLASGRSRVQTGSFAIDNLEMTFGVKATLGAGKAVEAFLTASGEATVQVKLTLRQPSATITN
jgi:hypothetical protein